jgi:hypothetical protein
MVSQDDYGTVILAGLLYNYVESRLGWPTASNSASVQVVQQSKRPILVIYAHFWKFQCVNEYELV